MNGFAAKAAGDFLLGYEGTKGGFIQKAEASAQAVGFETNQFTTIPLSKNTNIQYKQKGGGSVGAGAGEGFWIYFDTKTSRIYVGMMAKLKVLFGLEGEWEVSFGKKFVDDSPVPANALPFAGYTNTPGLGIGGIVRTILLGAPTVLIG